jgi:hypothetical protein
METRSSYALPQNRYIQNFIWQCFCCSAFLDSCSYSVVAADAPVAVEYVTIVEDITVFRQVLQLLRIIQLLQFYVLLLQFL